MTTNPGETRAYTELGDYTTAGELFVRQKATGPGIAALFVEGDPNGVVTGVFTQLAVDTTTGNVWQNTDDGTTWVLFAAGGGGAGAGAEHKEVNNSTPIAISPDVPVTFIRDTEVEGPTLLVSMGNGPSDGYRKKVIVWDSSSAIELMGLYTCPSDAGEGSIDFVWDADGAVWRVDGAAQNFTGAPAAEVNTDGVTMSGAGIEGDPLVAMHLPTTLTVNLNTSQDDWNPVGLATAFEVQINCTAAINITGIEAATLGSGRLFVLRNLDASTAHVTLVNNSGSSAANNQFDNPTGSDVILRNGDAVLCRYDPTAQKIFIVAFELRGALKGALTGDSAVGAAETVIASTSIPANFARVGTSFYVSAGCNQTGVNAASPIMRVRVGPTTLTGQIAATLTGISGATGGATASLWGGIVTIRTVGATGTIIGSLWQIKRNGGGVECSVLGATVTVDFTAANLIELTFESGNAANTYTFREAVVCQV